MVAYRIFGVSDWAARLPSAVDALLLVIAVYLFFRRFRPGIELDAALITASMAGMIGYARAASMDMALASAFGMAMLAWWGWVESKHRKFLAAFYFFLALGVLAKGPVAPFLAGVLIAVFATSQKNFRLIARTLWPSGIAFFLAVSLPWYIAVQLRNPQFFRVFILEHNFARFGTNLYHHPEPFWYYIPITLLGWMLWSALVTIASVAAVRKWHDQVADSLNAFALIWIGVVVVFFSISRSKLPGYVMPAVPAGAVLLGNYLRHKIMSKVNLAAAALHALLGASLIFPTLMIQIILREPNEVASKATVPVVASTFIGGLTFMLLLRGGYRMLRVATLIPAIIVVAVTLRAGAGALDRKLSARYVSEVISQYDSHHLPVAAYLVRRETEFGLDFYRNQVVPIYERGEIPSQEHLLVAAQGYPAGVARIAGRRVTFLQNLPEQKLDLFYVPAK
jgi:4-amino-4-deoxy-L-arabinose transferase-like glycosyltransferase